MEVFWSGWAVVEVGEDVIAGCIYLVIGNPFVQVDVPEEQDEEVGRQPAFTRFIPINAVQSITPCSEWAVHRILDETSDETLCYAFYLYAYTQHASEPDGTIPEPIDPSDIPF